MSSVHKQPLQQLMHQQSDKHSYAKLIMPGSQAETPREASFSSDSMVGFVPVQLARGVHFEELPDSHSSILVKINFPLLNWSMKSTPPG